MPAEVLYGIISFLGLALIAFGGVYVRAHDKHREWATEKITQHERVIAVLEATHRTIEHDMREIKANLARHLELEEGFQRVMLEEFKARREGTR
jgi:hypothetical protein